MLIKGFNDKLFLGSRIKMKKNVSVCVLIACLLLFSGCSLADVAASDDKVISETAANDGAFVLTEYDTRVTCECDLDKDGNDEIITADYSQTLKDHQLPINMNVSESDGEAILWQDMSLGLVSMGEKSYYVTALDGSVYLMEYHPPKDRQGLYDYSLKSRYYRSTSPPVAGRRGSPSWW